MRNLEIKNNQNGRSMIEMLGVLAIIGVLSVGGIAGYSKAMMKYRINKTIEQITLIAGNVRSFFAPQKNIVVGGGTWGKYYGVSDINILQKAKLVPDEMWNSDKSGLINAFGGSFSMLETQGTTGDMGEAFTLLLKDIPIEACIEIITQNWHNVFSSVVILDSLSDNSSDYSTMPYECSGGSDFIGNRSARFCKSDGGVPISVDNAVIACDLCTTDSLCDVAFGGQ